MLDRCEKCGGRMMVYTTRINFVAKVRIRYYCCEDCKHKPHDGKRVIPLEYAPQRLTK